MRRYKFSMMLVVVIGSLLLSAATAFAGQTPPNGFCAGDKGWQFLAGETVPTVNPCAGNFQTISEVNTVQKKHDSDWSAAKVRIEASTTGGTIWLQPQTAQQPPTVVETKPETVVVVQEPNQSKVAAGDVMTETIYSDEELQSICDGTRGLPFNPNRPLSSKNPCHADDGTAMQPTLIEPWRAGCNGVRTNRNCNVGYQRTFGSWREMVQFLKVGQWDRGSVWVIGGVYNTSLDGDSNTPTPKKDDPPAANYSSADMLMAFLCDLFQSNNMKVPASCTRFSK